MAQTSASRQPKVCKMQLKQTITNQASVILSKQIHCRHVCHQLWNILSSNPFDPKLLSDHKCFTIKIRSLRFLGCQNFFRKAFDSVQILTLHECCDITAFLYKHDDSIVVCQETKNLHDLHGKSVFMLDVED